MAEKEMGRLVTYNLNRRGFSLAELMVVVAITAILAGVSIPIFSGVLRNYQLKQVDDLKLAAKAAAVSAFYAGYDSKGKVVDITETGVCTFLYDAENSAVFVLNSNAGVQDFSNNGYASSIESYGINVTNGTDYSGQVILITFDGRYYKYKNDDPNISNRSKGTFEEPALKLKWYSAESLIK